MIRVIITGAAGRMGRNLIRVVAETGGVQLAGAIERPGSDFLGQDAGVVAGVAPLGCAISSDLAACVSNPAEGLDNAPADVIIDFTTLEATLAHAALAEQFSLNMVIGTTGLNGGQLQRLRAMLAGRRVVMAANFSVGVNLAMLLTERAARTLPLSYDAEIIEAHHRFKVDAPSGTALSLGKAVAAGRNQQFDDVARFAREGITGQRPDGEIGFSVVRAGDIVGEHSVLFATAGERLEIRHVATDRACFARGAVTAAQWLAGSRTAGWYDMRDVLALE